jgi:hypothetical protein
MNTNGCPICSDQSASSVHAPEGRDALRITCPKCGSYEIDGTTAASDLAKYGDRYLLSAIVRNRYELGEKVCLSANNLEHLIDGAPTFDDPYTKLDILLKHIHRLSGRVGRWAQFSFANDFPLLYCEDQQEFHFYVKKAKELDLIEFPISTGVRLTYSGWNRLMELSKTSIRSDQAFVAMWFDTNLDPIWQDAIKPALKSCGFNPMRVDLEEHNEKICDRIISEIRRSGLVVADFTGQRGGVYFESGFAMGLGIPVIRTCRKDNIGSLHFDTRQYSHVVWETPDELKGKLTNRILATIPRVDL